MAHAHEISDEEIGAYLIEHLAAQLDRIDAPEHPTKDSVRGDIRPGPSTLVDYVGSWSECTSRALQYRSCQSEPSSGFGEEINRIEDDQIQHH
jgi:hypothetical protein